MTEFKLSPFNCKSDLVVLGEQMGELRNLEPNKVKDKIAKALAIGKLSSCKVSIRAGQLKEFLGRRANGEPELKWRELEKDFD